MTAIAGLVDFDRKLVEQRDCERMLIAQLAFASRPAVVIATPSASFGAALFPTLPEDDFDQQPLSKNDLLLVADIRIDNRQELINGLRLDSPPARTLADSDILLGAWQQWGSSCLKRIVGDYAIAVYDEAANQLTLARSITGQRPLFYGRIGHRIAFASMPSGMLATPKWKPEFDRDSLIRNVMDMPCRPGATVFSNIHRVPTGRCMSLSLDGEIIDHDWQPEFSAKPVLPDDDGVQTYRQGLRDAVQCRLRRRSPQIAAHLSSGYDSSAVAATTAQLAMQPVIALTAAPKEGFDAPFIRGRIADESILAARTASMGSMNHRIVRESSRLVDRIRAQTHHYQEPRRNLVNSGWLHAIDQAAHAANASILLAAELGNLTFNAGGLPALADYWKLRGPVRWGIEATKAATRSDVRWRGILFNSWRSYLPAAVQNGLYGNFLQVVPSSDVGFVRRDVLDQHPDIVSESFVPSSSGSSRRDRWEVIRSLDYGTFRKGGLAEDQVETRDPTADQRLIQFSMQLAPEAMLSNGVFRPLARAALADRIPLEVINSPLRGIQSADWYERMERQELRDLADEVRTNATAFGLLDFKRIDRAIEKWPVSPVSAFEVYEEYAVYLPLALSVAFFIKTVEEGGLALP